MSTFPRIPIAELVIEGGRRFASSNDQTVWNLNLDQIEPDSGRILERQMVKVGDLGPSTYPFEAGTILYSKLRPYLNKVVLADRDGFATTELVSLRCDSGKVLPEYLAYFLRSAEFLRFATNVVAGAKMPRMVMSEFWRYEVPVPPLPEQRRIAAILDQAEALRAKRRAALAKLDTLAQGIFIELFGAYHKGAIPWSMVPLGEVASEMKIGLVRSAEEFGDAFSVPYVRMNAIGRRGEFLPELVQKTDVSERELAEYLLRPGDLLFNTRNSKDLVGKTALFQEAGDYVYNNNLMRIRFGGSVEPRYIAQCFLTPFIQQELELRKSGTTSVFAIYARDLNTLPIPLPSEDLQVEFAKRISALQTLKKRMSTQDLMFSGAFSSLQHRAFRGEL